MSTQLFDLTGRTAIVTGSGRGLGRAMAKGLAAAGAAVVVGGRTRADLEATVEAIVAAGGRAEAVVFDALKRADCARLVARAEESFGGLDILVVNHGVGRAKPALEVTDAELDETIDTDLASAFVCGQEGARAMIARGRGGAIVFISSTGSLVAFEGLSVYGAAKGGVDQMCRHFAQELAPHGIRVNCVNPGYTTHRMKTEDDGPPRPRDPDYEAMLKLTTPMARAAEPEEMVGPVIFLASDAASFVTGQVLPVDGGYVAI